MDANKTPRTWQPTDNIPSIAHVARKAAANVLSQLAVVRPPPLPEDAADAATDQAAAPSHHFDLVDRALERLATPEEGPGDASGSGREPVDR